MRFVDTNVLLYAISTEPRERVKAERAKQILSRHDLALSAQVLQEFYVQSTRPSRISPLEPGEAALLVKSFRRFPVLDLTADLVEAAMACQARYRISYWDAAIVEAARASGCPILLSEDLADGRDFGGVRIENPFRGLS